MDLLRPPLLPPMSRDLPLDATEKQVILAHYIRARNTIIFVEGFRASPRKTRGPEPKPGSPNIHIYE